MHRVRIIMLQKILKALESFATGKTPKAIFDRFCSADGLLKVGLYEPGGLQKIQEVKAEARGEARLLHLNANHKGCADRRG